MRRLASSLFPFVLSLAIGGCADPGPDEDESTAPPATVVDPGVQREAIVINPGIFLPNLKLQGSYVQYLDASGSWRIDFLVTNTGFKAAKIGMVRLQSFEDDGSPVFLGIGITDQWANVTVNPGQTVTLTSGPGGTVYYEGMHTSVAKLPSVAPYRIHVWIDYAFNDYPTTAESNENDNFMIFDLH